MPQLKTHHKVGIGATLVIIAIVIALASAGAFVVYHHYELKAGSPNMPPGDSPPSDSSQTSDELSSSVKHTSLDDSMTAPRDEKTISGYHTAEQITGDVNTYIKEHQGKGLIGIVHVFARHHDGTVFVDFAQHNTRTVQGIGCFGQVMFYPSGTPAVTNTTQVCPVQTTGSTHWNGFNVIALINGSTALVLNGSDKPDNSSVGNQCCNGHGTGGRASTKDGLIMTTSSNQGGPSQGTVANSGGLYNTWTVTSGTYTFSATSGMTVRGAMLINMTNSYPNKPVGYAENAFTPIALATGDSLTLTWTVSAS